MSDQDQMLEKVDIIRNRFGISYREAYDVLERSQGNVVQACMQLEGPPKASGLLDRVSDRVEQEVINVTGQDLFSKIQEIVRLGQSSRIAVRHNGRTVFTIPTAVGAIGALFFPYVTVAAAAIAVTAQYEIVLDKRTNKRAKGMKTDLEDIIDTRRKSGITNVHHEEKESFVPITASLSSGKEASLTGAALARNKE